ncbi:shikimate dehydrogenase [Sporolactobacillus shoreae]|uniref:Shikimate dehydrogenase (NADP(+)) n=1 Tax=Sporolactobacillus shoreae TaxID=1465501 RepID=A0A4Z0GSM3_9BACL|nr:shikimate dehydrogenase [Sporolactobacillus shoreae]
MTDLIDGRTRLYGLFAHPAEHSLSPLMHNLSFQRRQINAVYLAFDLTSDFSGAIQSIRELNMGGVNLSMPFKKQVIPYLDELTPTAKIVGAVNTVIHRQGRLIGANTDGTGFFENLRAHHYVIKNKTVTILGAGGAGLSIIAAGASEGLRMIHVFKRHNATFPKVEARLRDLARFYQTPIRLYAYDDRTNLQRAVRASDFLINTTHIGMGNDRQSMPLTGEEMKLLLPTTVVCDVIYEPRKTRLLLAAEASGCETVNGLGMLIYQGAQSFKLWTHEEMPVDAVRAAIEKESENKNGGIGS